eukprot:9117159-Pyramimonas_sp.AAC.1
MSIEGRAKGSLPGRVKWNRTLWLPRPGWSPPLTARVGQVVTLHLLYRSCHPCAEVIRHSSSSGLASKRSVVYWSARQ